MTAPEPRPVPSPMAEQLGRIYRKEALDELVKPVEDTYILDLAPGWTRWTYWLVVTICSAALTYAFFGRIDEYTTGTAILRQDGRAEVTARTAGIVDKILVRPGQRVRAGEELMRLHADSETADLLRIEEEFKLQLVRTLRDPADSAARAALTSLRAQKELAEARLAERVVRAPADAIVSDVRIRRGQRVESGEVTMSLMSHAGRFRVVAVLPGEYRPLLRRGMTMRLELRGFPYFHHNVQIDAVGDEVLGPNEVRRALGAAAADTFTPEGGSVLVEGHLPEREFVVDGHRLAYFDGMQGTTEVAVRSERIIVTLLPALKAIASSHD